MCDRLSEALELITADKIMQTRRKVGEREREGEEERRGRGGEGEEERRRRGEGEVGSTNGSAGYVLHERWICSGA